MASFEGLDDDHAAAAARARRSGIWRFDRGIVLGRWCDRKQSAGVVEMSLAGGAGEQAVMTDPMEPAWQDVEQEVGTNMREIVIIGRRPRPALQIEPLPGSQTEKIVASNRGCRR
ncbi:MAG: hypothetical protein NVS3B5_06980 [Sphingomicrobium sp.]